MLDVLVVGSGAAGLRAGLSAKNSVSSVLIASKQFPTRSQTCMAQGGINAALSHSGEDSVEQHFKDTIKAGNDLANEDAVKKLTSNAKEAIEYLESIGVCFSRDENSKIAQRKLGGAYASRACYAQDFTGLKILHTLYDECNKQNIEFKNDYFLLDLLVENNRCFGAIFLDKKTGKVEEIKAKSVILATGGYSKIYGKYSTNSSSATGDALAIAYSNGAKLSDMEFVQFHPTALKNSSILISESARGSGGYLVNSKGERFTDELAPRDIVSRAIDDEIKKGEDIFLDIRHLGEEFIDEELPQERKLAKLYEKIDPVSELIPIKPSAHYTMGGLEVDENSMSSIEALFGVGECANHKVHGANRLGGNSLLELIVFGKEVGENACSFAKNSNLFDAQNVKENILQTIKTYTNEVDFYKEKEALAELFYKNVGISRDESSLNVVLLEISKMKENLPFMGVKDKSEVYNTNLIEFLEFMNILKLSELIVSSALKRKESRGAHFRSDYLSRDDINFQTHSIASLKGNSLNVEFKK